jgi:tetratricopeptide (TPR) repeat protein
MASVHASENIDELNQQALATLARAIALAQSRFALTIVRCSYTALQRRFAPSLKSACPVQIQELVLPPQSETIWQPIINATAHYRQKALLVTGLEDLYNPSGLLRNLEVEQSELVSRCQLPIVLWLTEEGCNQLIKLAPRFYANAITSITLRASDADLEMLWRESSDRLFAEIVAQGVDRFLDNHQIGFGEQSRQRREFKAATKDLNQREAVPLALTATWHLIMGRDYQADGEIGKALVHYQKSLNIWEQMQGQTASGDLHTFTHDTLQIRWALVKLHMGYCYYQQAQAAGSAGQSSWQLARDTFLSVARIFEEQQRFELVVQVLTLTGDTLRALGNWLELDNIASTTLNQRELQDQPLNLAQAHGFLAEVALHHNDFDRAAEQARRALHLTQEVTDPNQSQIGNANLARYLLQVAKAEARSREYASALDRLEQAKSLVTPESNVQLYLDIMQELRLLHYHTGQFWESFQIKQQQQVVRYEKGLAAFVSTAAAPDHPSAISALGREQDVRAILERLGDEERSLLVIHGENGMGKTSLLQGGLVPTLKDSTIQGRAVTVVYQQEYHHWLTVLSENLSKASGLATVPGTAEVPRVRQQLYFNINNDLATVLIFDQFEEFFLALPEPQQRLEFYQFIQSCLALPHIKICLGIRQENLHQLLDCERFLELRSASHDTAALASYSLLDRQLRYQLRNFSIDQACSVIERLTSNCRYYLEPALAEQFVADLADDYGEVSPVQLQVLGAQLQAENVKTIGQYLQLGLKPQQYLIERALEESIRDCGRDNYDAVITTLFLLTDERGNCPQRTFSQLLPATRSLQNATNKSKRRKIPALMPHQHNYYAQLMLMLNILAGSGLIGCTKDDPENRYQLLHESLVTTIRSKYGDRAPLAAAPAVGGQWNRIQRRSIRVWRRWSSNMVLSIQQIVYSPLWSNLWRRTCRAVEASRLNRLAQPTLQAMRSVTQSSKDDHQA